MVAAGINLIGGWDTVTGQNGHFLVVLQIANPMANPILEDIHVTGQMINSDGAPQYNGTLQGTIPRGSRTLTYTFFQPQTKGSGAGQFILSQDGNSITGTGAGSSTAGGEVVQFTWNGTRAK